MSLYRLITRIAVVSALNNYLQGEPWPTLAGPNIFDSKIEPVEDMQSDRVFPCCVVYTDYDKDPWAKAGKAHDDRHLTVNLELMIVQATQVPPGNDGQGNPLPITYKLDCPYTDSEIESSLDAFEVQIFRALTAGTAASDAFNYICPAYSNVISRRGASVEGGVRLAARQITMEMKAIRDNVVGNIPEAIETFLSVLEQHNDYAERVSEIRALMTAHASQTPFEHHMRTFGYTRDLATRLGSPPGPLVMLPSNLTFHYEGLTP
jgi:hypothetical protein